MTAPLFDPWQWIRDNTDDAPSPPPTLAALATLAAPDDWPSLPADWRDGLTRLRNASSHPAAGAETWARLLADALDLADAWAPQAFALGWSAVDLFGVDPDWGRRLDRDGLAASLEGRKVVAVTHDAATLSTRSGGFLRHYRRDKPGSVPIWSAGTFCAGEEVQHG